MKRRISTLCGLYSGLLLLSVLAILGITLVGVAVGQLQSHQKQLRHAVLSSQIMEDERRLAQNVPYLRQQLTAPLLNLDMTALNEVIGRVKPWLSITRFIIVDARGQILTDGSRENPSYGQMVTVPEGGLGSEVLVTHHKQTADVEFSIDFGGETQGYALISLSVELFSAATGQVDRVIATSYKRLGLSLAGVLVLGLVLALLVGVLLRGWLARKLSRPLAEMRVAVESLAQGEGYEPLPAYANQELRGLAGSLNRLNKALGEDHALMSKGQKIAALGSWKWAVGSRWLVCSESLFHLFRYHDSQSRFELEGLLQLVDHRDRDKVSAIFRKQRAAGLFAQEFRAVTTDGELRLLRMQGEVAATKPGEVRCLTGTIQDITQRRQTEAAFCGVQKLSLVAGLAGGLVQDLSAPLGIAIGHLELLQRLQGVDSKVAKWAARGLKSAILAQDRLVQLRSVAMEYESNAASITDINLIIKGMQDLIGRLISKQVEVNYQLTPVPWPVNLCPDQCRDALLNLVLNAHEAMPNGGRLSIETSNKTLDEEALQHQPGRVTGDYLLVRVSDTGTGMTQEVMGRIFEPFFTTKVQDRNLGLGLSMVRQFVEASEGYVDVISQLDMGSSFCLYLPRQCVSARRLSENG